MNDPLQKFLKHHAPQPPVAGEDLEARILGAALTPTRRFAVLSGPAVPLLTAASLVLLLGGLGLWRQIGGPVVSPSGVISYEPTESAVFAVDPRTDLYEVRY